MNKNTISQVMILVNEMAKKKKGSFFVITKNDISKKYDILYPDLFKGKDFNIKDKETQTLLLYLSEMDGAIIVNDDGKVVCYGAKIKRTKILFGHGTRHSAARGISQEKDVMAIISSEEDGQIRIFQNGNLMAEINPETGKNIRFFEKLGELFSKPDIQVATSSGVASLLLGFNPLLAGVFFTGSFIITRYGIASIKDFIKTGRIVVKKELNVSEADKQLDIKNAAKKKSKK